LTPKRRHSSFSGVLGVDEGYQGRLAPLVAVDPAAPEGDRLVGYELVTGSVEAGAVETFLERLRTTGVEPAQVVTDGSALYPGVVAKVWPRAAHQLCLFHQTRRGVKAVRRVVDRVRSEVPKPQSPARQRGRMRPPLRPPQAARGRPRRAHDGGGETAARRARASGGRAV
jgi:hypothetical protein